jgi:hypothetical protein
MAKRTGEIHAGWRRVWRERSGVDLILESNFTGLRGDGFALVKKEKMSSDVKAITSGSSLSGCPYVNETTSTQSVM